MKCALAAAAVFLALSCRGREEPKAALIPVERTVAGTFIVLGPAGRPLPAGVAVYDAEKGGRPAWEGMAGDRYALPPGRYDVLMEYYGQQYWRRGEDFAGGEKSYRLPMGTLTVAARSSRGADVAAAVAVFAPAKRDGAPLVEGRAGEPLALLAGDYDVRVTLAGEERWLGGVTVTDGGDRRETVLTPVGYLVAEVIDQRGAPLAAEVWVYASTAATTPLVTGRAGTPFPLAPGRYDVAARWRDARDYSAGVGVRANETTREIFTFWQEEKP